MFDFGLIFLFLLLNFQAFFGVFDGHGGAKAAEFAANNLEKNILNELERMSENERDFEQAIKHGYLTTDSDFLKENHRGGSCCVTALIQKGNLVVSNAGDCRAVLSSEGVAEAITSDHRPAREDERHRIESTVRIRTKDRRTTIHSSAIVQF